MCGNTFGEKCSHLRARLGVLVNVFDVPEIWESLRVLRIVVMMFKEREVWVRMVDARSGYYRGGEAGETDLEVCGTAHGTKSATRVFCMV